VQTRTPVAVREEREVFGGLTPVVTLGEASALK
jgi:hypothetical protein